MEKRTKIITSVVIAALLAIAGYATYAIFLTPHTSLPTNNEINTSLSLQNGTYRDLVDFNLPDGGFLWINYTADGPLTVYVLNATQMNGFAPGSNVSSYYSPGNNLDQFSQTKPVDLASGLYHIVFFNSGNSSTLVKSANISWYPKTV